MRIVGTNFDIRFWYIQAPEKRIIRDVPSQLELTLWPEISADPIVTRPAYGLYLRNIP